MAPAYGWREPERSIRNAHTAMTMPAPVARATRTPPMRSLDQRRATQTKPKMLIDRLNGVRDSQPPAGRITIEDRDFFTPRCEDPLDAGDAAAQRNCQIRDGHGQKHRSDEQDVP